MIEIKSIPILAAAVLARIPNFILPIFAVRIFDLTDYSTFALAFATASAMAAFLGEAISVTISRETYQVDSDGGLAAFFCGSTLVSYLAIIVCLTVYNAFSFGVGGGTSTWLIGLLVAMLAPAYLLPSGSVALAHAHGKAHVSGIVTIVGMPISLVISFALGMTFGLVYFVAAYSAFIISMNIYIYIKVIPKDFRFSPSRATKTLRSYGPAFLAVLGTSMLGGPIHGLCLSMLSHKENGVTQLAMFVAYYPWSIVVSFVPTIATNYVIQKIGQLMQSHDIASLRGFVQRVLIMNVMIVVLVSMFVYGGRGHLFEFYKATIASNEPLFGWVVICGIGAACVVTSTQILIGMRRSKGLLIVTISHAILYTGLTALFVERLGLGAIGLAQSLSISLFVLALGHLILIYFYLRRGAESGRFSLMDGSK